MWIESVEVIEGRFREVIKDEESDFIVIETTNLCPNTVDKIIRSHNYSNNIAYKEGMDDGMDLVKKEVGWEDKENNCV